MYKKILVTGGAGFIGSHIVDELIKHGYAVRIMDNLDAQVHPGRKKPVYLNKAAEFFKGDVTVRADWQMALEGVDAVFHEASAVGVGQSQYQIEHYTKVNTLGTAIFLDILANQKHSVRKIVVAASMSSYGEGLYLCPIHGKVRPMLRPKAQLELGDWQQHCPICSDSVFPTEISETEPQHCTSIYAINKKDQEDMIMSFGRSYGIPTTALRYFNAYGPRQSLSNPYTGVAAIFISRLINNHAPVIYEDGLQMRDFVSVHDIAKANVLALESVKAEGQSFNVGSGKGGVPIITIAEILAEKLGKKIKPDVTKKFRAGDIRDCLSDNSKIKYMLGFLPLVSFDAGMNELIEWSRSQSAMDKFEVARSELSARKLI